MRVEIEQPFSGHPFSSGPIMVGSRDPPGLNTSDTWNQSEVCALHLNSDSNFSSDVAESHCMAIAQKAHGRTADDCITSLLQAKRVRRPVCHANCHQQSKGSILAACYTAYQVRRTKHLGTEASHPSVWIPVTALLASSSAAFPHGSKIPQHYLQFPAGPEPGGNSACSGRSLGSRHSRM